MSHLYFDAVYVTSAVVGEGRGRYSQESGTRLHTYGQWMSKIHL